MYAGGRVTQEAVTELATWQKCYREVAYTEARDLISYILLIRDRAANVIQIRVLIVNRYDAYTSLAINQS